MIDCRKLFGQKSDNLLIEDMVSEFEEVREPIYDDAKVEDEFYGDAKETLIIHKSLLTPKGDSKDDLFRTNIFHRTYTVTDKICKMIIDSGNCPKRLSRNCN